MRGRPAGFQNVEEASSAIAVKAFPMAMARGPMGTCFPPRASVADIAVASHASATIVGLEKRRSMIGLRSGDPARPDLVQRNAARAGKRFRGSPAFLHLLPSVT
jgi:hypothetical protein